MVTINIYIEALLKLQRDYQYKLYVHPVVPVLDVTRFATQFFPVRSLFRLPPLLFDPSQIHRDYIQQVASQARA